MLRVRQVKSRRWTSVLFQMPATSGGWREAWASEPRVGGERPPCSADQAEAAELLGREAEQDLVQHVRRQQAVVVLVGEGDITSRELGWFLPTAYG